MPFFSIIVPTYNRADAMRKLIESLNNQTFKDYEVIIVDDGSTDNTSEELSPLLGESIRFFSIQNHERAYARNYGLLQAKGEYINYFDSDDRFINERLDVIFKFIQTKNYPNVLFSHYYFENENGEIIGEMKRYFSKFEDDIVFNNFLATGSVFLKREVALRNKFHENRDLITAEDWELWLRISSHYAFEECLIKTFAIVQHPNRSLRNISSKRIEIRDSYFAQLVKSNVDLINHYGASKISLFRADRYTFIALAYMIDRQLVLGMKYLFIALMCSWRVFGRKRFWGVIKNLI